MPSISRDIDSELSSTRITSRSVSSPSQLLRTIGRASAKTSAATAASRSSISSNSSSRSMRRPLVTAAARNCIAPHRMTSRCRPRYRWIAIGTAISGNANRNAALKKLMLRRIAAS